MRGRASVQTHVSHMPADHPVDQRIVHFDHMIEGEQCQAVDERPGPDRNDLPFFLR